MGSIFGGGGGGSFNVPGGLTPFQTAAFNQATAENQGAMANRYNQLGLGGSTMEQQDVSGLGLLGLAAAAPLEAGNVANQLAANNLANQQNQQLASSLGSLASAGIGSIGSLLGLA